MSDSLKVAVVYGSVRSGRQGIKAARFMQKQIENRGHTVTLIDPLEHELPFLDKMYKEYPKGEAPPTMEFLATTFREADAIVIVSAEYNHSIPAALKNIIDHFMEEFFFKPSAIVCYSAGSFGGIRGAMQLRSILPEVGMPSIPSLFPISKVQDSFDDNGNALDDAYPRRVVKFLDELEWYAKALKKARETETPY